MYVLAGTVWERPQETHFRNNHKLNRAELADLLDPSLCVTHSGIEGEKIGLLLDIVPRFHMQIFGGWRHYVLLRAGFRLTTEPWYVGWINDEVAGMSRIPAQDNVRCLLGPGPVMFFGIKANGEQARLSVAGYGKVGHAGPTDARTPLR